MSLPMMLNLFCLLEPVMARWWLLMDELRTRLTRLRLLDRGRRSIPMPLLKDLLGVPLLLPLLLSSWAVVVVVVVVVEAKGEATVVLW